MDIQSIITNAVAKLKANPDLLKKFASDPAGALKAMGFNVSADQINKVIDGIKSQIDLSKVDVSQATGIIAKIKKLFGK